jgi:threonine/homoserine/homoserine lactone efflux protein
LAGGILSETQPWQQVLALVLAATVVMGSPGPATISVTAVGAAFGLRPSLGYTSGVAVGTIAVLLAVATGIFGMLTSLPVLAPVLAIASAAYILFLAFKIATAPPLAERGSMATKPDFPGGFMLAVANPKAYVAIGAVFAGAASQADTLGVSTRLLVLAVMIVAIHVVWLLAGTAFARFLRHPLASRIINLVFAAMLVLTTLLAALR